MAYLRAYLTYLQSMPMVLGMRCKVRIDCCVEIIFVF